MLRVWSSSVVPMGEMRQVNSVRRDEDGHPHSGKVPGHSCVLGKGTCGVGTAADLPLNAKITGVP